ncbi:S24/S26 family peptidase [Nocardioides dongxiaopingii]|uniref:S24/S26 family peptidase n=1 Tax=Nocardioides dongxiaopingii TaxID=2576036 RepID=UPI001FE56368|nr:S24/S26 family peptidase [Nocardioides dongxiaopingii]
MPTLRMVRVRGRSMLPALRPGDRLLVLGRRGPRPGDVVVARFPDGTAVVKRVAERRGSGWWLLSDNAAEGLADSRARGAVGDDAVLGVVAWRIWPRPGRVARRV